MAGCGSNPVVGRWSENTPSGTTLVSVFDFEANGTLTETFSVVGCTGMVTLSGATWSVSGSTLTVTTAVGLPPCTGSVTCTNGGMTSTVDCSMETAATMMTVSGTYTISSDNDTLTVMDNDGEGGTAETTTFTRVPN